MMFGRKAIEGTKKRNLQYGATGLTTEKRKANLAEINRRKDLQDLYSKESKKRSDRARMNGTVGFANTSGRRPGESVEYGKRMTKLKLMSEGKKIPSEMRNVFGL